MDCHHCRVKYKTLFRIKTKEYLCIDCWVNMAKTNETNARIDGLRTIADSILDLDEVKEIFNTFIVNTPQYEITIKAKLKK